MATLTWNLLRIRVLHLCLSYIKILIYSRILLTNLCKRCFFKYNCVGLDMTLMGMKFLTLLCSNIYFSQDCILIFQILSYLRKEKRLGKPNNCPDWLYERMLRCWENSTQDRAKAQDVVNCINEEISEYSSQYEAVFDRLD